MNLRFAPLLLIASPVFILAAGCGGGGYSANPSNKTFSITPSTQTIDTNQQVQLSAALAAEGGAANVRWAILSGQNNSQIGQGSIDQNGLYTPPSALSQDTVQVKIQANLTNSLLTTATSVITVTPGFNQPVLPENATLSSGSTVPLSATIAEVGGGSVKWSLSSSASSIASPGSNSGSIGSTKCTTTSLSSQNPAYTFCTATYTAPTSAAPTGPLFAFATVTANPQSTSYAKLLLNNSGINTSPLTNQAAQTSAVEMGTSGGNNNDFDTDSSGNILDCASGTLGALVSDQNSNQYILSNNHVLAESDQGATTDSIIQPGLVDTGCQSLQQGITGIRALGTLKYSVPLNTNATNVDAALASVASGTVDPTGGILALGTASSGTNGQLGPAAPAAGTGEVLTAANLNSIHVAKSGRTTGLTCSTVDNIAVTFQIDYYKDAAGTIFYTTKTFTNQIGVPGRYFSDFGDSGSLVVDTANAQPVGLFFAGAVSSDNTSGESFANPIGDVLTELSQQSAANGSLQLQVVGGAAHPVTCLNYDSNTVAPSSATVAVPASQTLKAKTAASTLGSALLSADKGILGVAAGKSLDQPGQASVIVYVDPTKPSVAVPQSLGGLPTVVIPATATSIANDTAPVSLTPVIGIHLSQPVLSAAIAVHDQYASQIMADPAFFGVGVTQSYDNPAEAALVVYVDLAKTPRAEPATIDGLRVRYMPLHRIRITLGQSSGTAAAHNPAHPE